MSPPFHHTDYSREWIGVDEESGRFADVEIERCKHCGQRWLRYSYEIEAFSRSGRWYRGAVSEEVAKSTSAAGAPEVLGGLEWLFYGGSYFSTSGARSSAPLNPATM